MKFEYRKIEEAFKHAGAERFSSRRALLDTQTGEVLIPSESPRSDSLSAAADENRFVALPTRIELHLGKPLVISFTKTHLAGSLPEVYGMFCYKNADARFQEILNLNNMLDLWREFERRETESALREWCRRQSISLLG